MSFVGLDHVQVLMPPGSEETARAFYVGVLGMEELVKPPALRTTGALWFQAGAAQLHVRPEADFRPSRQAHPGIRVTDVDEIAARCTRSGHPVEWDERYAGVRRFYVADPFGNRLEFLQPA